MTDGEVIVPGESQDNSVTSKRGLDVSRVEQIMAREQERDLKLIYRIDQLKPFDAEAKNYHKKAKPSDPLAIQLFFEIRDRYEDAKESDPKLAQEYLKMMQKFSDMAQNLRTGAMQRLFEWKKHAEAQGHGLGDLSEAELRALANG